MSELPVRILITGATSDLGRAIALRLGSKVPLVLHGRDEASLRELCVELGGEHSIWVCDFEQGTGIAESLGAFLASGVRITQFVHCAAKFQVMALPNSSVNATREAFNVGVFSASAIIKTLLQKRTNDAALQGIVFVSSIAADFGAKGYAVYSATKGALDSLRRSLAVELAPKVRVNSVSPGGIKTRTTEFLFSEAMPDSGYLLGPGEVGDVADAVEFLLSGKSRWVTGQSIIVDGGKSAH